MQPRRTPAFHSYLRTSDVPLLCEDPFGILALENRPVSTLYEDNRCTATKFESVWTLRGGATVAMNKSKRLTHYMTVSPIAFRHNLRLSPTPAHAQPRGIRTYRREPLVFHGVLSRVTIEVA
jgi:hypothetical protein